MPSLLMYGLLALAVLGALGGIYGAGYRSGSNSVMNEWQTASMEQRAREEKRATKAAEKKEQGDAKAKVVYRTIYRDVEKVVERPSYSSVCLDADGLQLARDAIAGTRSDTPKPFERVRPAPGTSGRESRLDIALDYGRF